jgi:putative nucleotidyltransferase with HDIG domain
MKSIKNHITRNSQNLYKAFLFVLAVFLIVLMFPMQGKFKYEFQRGKPWRHADLIAPFDFAIFKTTQEVRLEKEKVLKDFKPYFTYNDTVRQENRQMLIIDFENLWQNNYPDKLNDKKKNANLNFCLEIYDSIYNKGIIRLNDDIKNKPGDYFINLVKNNVAESVELKSLYTIQSAFVYIQEIISNNPVDEPLMLQVLQNAVEQNIIFDEKTTELVKQSLISNISLTRGMVQLGERVISKGELVDNEKYLIIESLKKEYEFQLGASTKYWTILLGQILLVCISITVLILFISSFRKDVFADNKKIAFILLSIFLMVFVTSITIHFDEDLLYLIPICIVPIIIKVFFDTRLALFVHLVTIIIIGFMVPNSFEFIFLQLIAGIISIISVADLKRRSQLFITSFLIFITYSATYFGMTIMQEGTTENIFSNYFLWFAGSSTLTLIVYPLIFINEKMFGLPTDFSLMELSDTNSKLLRELSMKAPGTFQHSLQVANLSQEAIYHIGGNPLLVRTGALYHDIGKTDMSMFFIENQTTGLNPHDELQNEDSAKIIISHVIKGVEKARKGNIPEYVIDFIRTHHGTTRTRYFYNMFIKNNPGVAVDENVFTYKGTIPYSKETAVVMMADAVEAASRSLKLPDEEKISNLVESIINYQVEQNQFLNSNITFKDISTIKKVFKKKLGNIFHIRVEYPQV